MGKNTKIWLLVAAALVLLGCAISVGVMAMLQWDFKNLSTVKYETNTYEIREEFEDLSIKTDTADIRFLPAADGKCTVVCYEEANAKHSVQVQNGTLTVGIVSQKALYHYIGINFGTPKITVYLPQEQYGNIVIQGSTCDVEIPKDFSFASMDISVSTGNVKNYASASGAMKFKTSTGDICVENISAGVLDLTVSTGKVTASGINCEGDLRLTVSTGKASLSDTRCANLISAGNTGDLSLRNVIAAEKLSITRTTGDVKFDGCDAAELKIKTNTGSVTGSLLSDKIFFAESDTGSIHVPKTTTGGRCEITTSTGKIHITIE